MQRAKVDAVEREDFEKAKQLQALVEQLKGVASEIADAEAAKREAVAREDYDSAARFKKVIDEKRAHAVALASGNQDKNGNREDEIAPASQSSRGAIRNRGTPPGETIAGSGSESQVPSVPATAPSSPPLEPPRSSSPPIPTLRKGRPNQPVSEEVVVQAKQPSTEDEHPTGARNIQSRQLPIRSNLNLNQQLQMEEDKDNRSQKTGDSKEVTQVSDLPEAKQKEAAPLAQTFGEKLILPLYAKTWQVRETGVKEIQDALPELFSQSTDKVALFKSCMKLMEDVILTDKISHVYFRGLDVLKTLLGEVQPVSMIKSSVIQGSIGNVVGILVDKAGDSNPKIRELSTKLIFWLAEHPSIGPSFIASIVMKNKKNAAPKLVTSKLEIVSKLLDEYGSDTKDFPKEQVITFLFAAFSNPNGEVRNTATAAVVTAYQQDKNAVIRHMSGIKPQIKEVLETKFKEIDSDPKKRQKQTQRQQVQKQSSFKASAPTQVPSLAATPSQKEQQQQSKRITSPEPFGGDLEESFEASGACPFCGLEDESFSEEGVLDLHLMKECPVLTECKCGQVIEVSCLFEHQTRECDKRNEFKPCKKCHEPVHNEDKDTHPFLCQPLARAEWLVKRCPLCKSMLHSIDDMEWRRHLMEECTKNARVSI